MAKDAVRPRNFSAMREDRVRAMAEAHFGRVFHSKSEAIDALAMLSPELQRSLKKPGASGGKSRPKKPVSKFSNELRGGVAVPTSAKLAAARPEVVQRYARATIGLETKSKAQALTLMAKFGPTDVAKASGAALQKSRAQAVPRATKPQSRLIAGMSGANVQAAPTADRAASNRMISGMSGNGVLTAAPASKGPAGWSDAARSAAAEKRAASASSRMIKGMSGKGRLGAIVALTVAAGSVIADAMGSDAMAKEPQKKPTGPSGNTVKVKQAEAAAKAAEAQAKEAEARTRQIEAETKQKELDAAAKERADKMATDQAERTFDVAVNVGAYGAGMVAGAKVSSGLDKKFADGLVKKNAALDDLAQEVSGLVDKRNKYTLKDGQRMRAVVKTADKVGLTKTGRGAAGPVFGGGLIALGATSRALSSKIENETVATIVNATGTAEVVAGVGVLVKDLANRASSPAVGNVKALAKIEQARAVSEPPAPRGQARVRKSSTLSKLSKTAGKLALPVAVVGAALIAAQSAAKAGESNTDAATDGAKAGADVLTGGAISEFEAAKAQGASDAEAAARGTAIGVINTATMGIATAADASLRETTGGGVSENIADMLKRGVQAGLAYLNDNAKQKAEALPAAPAAPSMPAAPKLPKSDGRTESYTRVLNGKAVQVAGYSTPKK